VTEADTARSLNAPNRKTQRREFPFWLLAAVLLGLLFCWLFVANGDYRTIIRALSHGVFTTAWVSVVAYLAAAVVGLVVALGRRAHSRVVREVATFYVEIVRGIPVLVLLFYVAFVGAPALVQAWNWLWAWPIAWGLLPGLTMRGFDMTARAIFALTVSYSAFLSEIFRAGIESVPQAQVEGAHALGLSRMATFRFVIFPQAFRTVLPPLGNDFVAMIKDSALVSSLGVQDITQIGKVYSSSTFLFFQTYNVVAFLYLVMTTSLSLMVRALERYLKQHGWAGTQQGR
jgi:polar amino acid transport system permease protein